MSNIVSFTVETGDSHYELDYIENSGLAYGAAELQPLDDTFEKAAHDAMCARLEAKNR